MNTPKYHPDVIASSAKQSRTEARVSDRSRTAKIAGAVGGAVLALLPIPAKAELLGTKLDNGNNNYYEIMNGSAFADPQLNAGATKDRFKTTFLGFIDDMTSSIFGKELRIKNNKNDGVVIEVLSKSAIENNCLPSADTASCFYIMNADGTIKHTVAFSPGIIVDGQQKWSTCEIPDSIHPSKNKEEIKLVKSTGVSGVFRVPIESTNYCVDKVKDTKEATGSQTYLAPETKDLVDLSFYDPDNDVWGDRFKVRDSNGNLIGLNRNSDGTWIAVTAQQDKDDFTEQDVVAMIERETPDGRKVTIMMLNAFEGMDLVTRIYVLEKHPDWMPENPKWSEVPATVEAVYETDPSFVLDDDGDGVPNSVEEASGGCIGYTDADKVDVNADKKSDTCQLECETYANEYDGTLTPSDLLPCASDLGYESAGQLKDGSTLHYNGTAPVLGDDGTIIAQSSSKLRYIHATLVGAVDAPELARNVALPDGYGAEIKVNSGTAHVTGTDFLGQPVEFTVTPESGLVDLGFIYGAETGIEGSDVEFTIGGEYQPCQNVACQSQNPEPPAAEPAQTVEETQTAEVPTKAEATQTEPPAQVELPTPQPEPVLVAEIPMPVAEPIAEPATEPGVEPAPDVVENQPETVDTGSVIIPPADTAVSSPEADTAVYVDMPAQNPDTPPVSPDTLQDTPQNNPDTKKSQDVAPTGIDTSPDTQPAPDTPSSEDTADAGGEQDLKAGVDATKTDNAPSTDAPVQSEDTQSGTDTLQNADTNQPNKPDTANQPDKPKDGGGGGGCAIENPDDPSALAYLAGLGSIALAWASARRRWLKEVLDIVAKA